MKSCKKKKEIYEIKKMNDRERKKYIEILLEENNKDE